MGHQPRKCDVGIGLGSHDLGVAVIATSLYNSGYFPYIVFTGANAPTTINTCLPIARDCSTSGRP